MAEQRLIDANALDTRERGNNSQRAMWWEIRKIINEAPTVDAKPVVHAHWERYPDCGVTKCSNCGWSIEECWDSKWCPECGAQMDEKEG